MEINIRKATPADIETITEFNTQLADHHVAIDSYYATGEELISTFPEFLKQDIEKETSLNLIVEVEGKIIGWFSGSIKIAPPHISEKIIGHIGSGFILAEYRGKGASKIAITEMIKWFKEKGVRVVDLSVDSRNIEGVSAWEGIGFKEYVKKMKMEI